MRPVNSLKPVNILEPVNIFEPVIFLEPVDLNEFTDYGEYVDSPMDMATVRKKLATKKYQGPENFARDMRKVSAFNII